MALFFVYTQVQNDKKELKKVLRKVYKYKIVYIFKFQLCCKKTEKLSAIHCCAHLTQLEVSKEYKE